ncbi:alpha-1,3/1,6-mannosyltransferase ALG2 [Eurosta solidaginis]|uniref:alpha-1,3/1,6-mannosyltransferase ALG2 n=1 Tax=Eurosta solidaginis TaxID=178769 RepID=UPI003530E016
MVRILFIHPDLGIGGAERLVVDAALALQTRGHDVSFLTNHHDPAHCFKETADGTLRVQVVGDWLPRKIFGRFYAFCAYLRMVYAALYASFVLSHPEKVDVFFCDLISVGVPILRLAKRRPKIIFYCHFPDQLLSMREGYLKSVYRAPLNYLEEVTVGMADVTLVNSKFTLRIFGDTFRRLNIVPDVLYPSLNTQYFDTMQTKIATKQQNVQYSVVSGYEDLPRNAFVYLDINRFERKKNHALALHSFRFLVDALPVADARRCRLIVAGGYDERVNENVEHFEELRQLVDKLGLQENVLLLRSPNDDEKFMLLHKADCLLYTPENEHFGIVPLEGMYMSKPVVALNSGGPTETIVNSSTGFLCEKQPQKFAAAMLQLYRDNALRERMGVMGRKRVQQKFSFEAFTDKLCNIVENIMKPTWTRESNKKKGE